MTTSFLPILWASIVALLVYSITFSIYKTKHVRKFPTLPLFMLMAYVVITLLMAAYSEKYVKMYIVGPIFIGSIFAYPVFSSAILLRMVTRQDKKRWLLFASGLISSILYIAVFLYLLNTK